MITKDPNNKLYIDILSDIEVKLHKLGYKTHLGCYFQDSGNRWWISLQLVKLSDGKAWGILDYVGGWNDRFIHTTGLQEIALEWKECYDAQILKLYPI